MLVQIQRKMNTFASRSRLFRPARNVVLRAEKMKLKQITIQGFKSFDQEGATIRFGDATVLLGANGVGKSNVVSSFKMLNFMAAGAFQTYVAEQGFAGSLCYYGSKISKEIYAKIELNDDGDPYYEMYLSAISDQVVFRNETISDRPSSEQVGRSSSSFGGGKTESTLLTLAIRWNPISQISLPPLW